MAQSIKIPILGDASSFVRAVRTARGEADTLGGKLRGMSGAAKIAFGGAAGAAVVFGKQAVSAGSNLNETLSKSNTVFGEQAKSIETWAGSAATNFGQSKQQALEAASSFGNMFSQLGVGEKQAADMSVQMTELASDFASFHNADISEVLTAQQAAFRGEYDALQKFVPTINAAAVEQKALAMTGKKTTKELTAQEKALAVQALMMEGAGDAAGDFERTSDGLANKQRILSAQVGDLQAKIGQALIPVVEKVVGAFSAMATWVQENQGKAQLLAGIVGGILTAAFVAWGASVLAATWPIIAIGAAIAALVAGVIYAYTHWGWFRDAVDAVASFLTDTLWPALQTVWSFIRDNLIPIIVEVIEKYVDFYSKVAEVAAGIIRAFVGVVQWFAGLPGTIRGYATSTWEALKSGLRNAVNWILDQLDRILGPLDEIAGKVGSVVGKLGDVGGAVGGFLGFDSGGVVPGAIGAPKLVLAHGGETILPTHKGGVTIAGGGGQTTVVVVEMGGREFGRFVVDALGRVEASEGAVRVRTRAA